MNLVGELAALATSFFFAMTALIFTSTGRLVGSQVTNLALVVAQSFWDYRSISG